MHFPQIVSRPMAPKQRSPAQVAGNLDCAATPSAVRAWLLAQFTVAGSAAIGSVQQQLLHALYMLIFVPVWLCAFENIV